ncbi:MAG: hypothetical protein KAV99_07300 [Candidatus Latescibacteria bacterium]|nr:hypothetical protein [Candidatus Latescibacterota bacterium]
MRIYTAILIVLLLLVFGCRNPFATREPEPPTGEQLPLLEPTSAENVLKNLEISCEHMSINNYMDTLSEDFLFLPDPSDSDRFPDVFSEPWGREEESIFCQKLFDKEMTTLISFSSSVDSNATVIEETADFVHYRYDYHIALIHHTDAPRSVKGSAEFSLRCDQQGNWIIFHWEDEKTDSHTWGELRATF